MDLYAELIFSLSSDSPTFFFHCLSTEIILPIADIEINNGKTHFHCKYEEIMEAIDKCIDLDYIWIEGICGIHYKSRSKLKRKLKIIKFRLFYKIYDSKQIYLYKKYGKIVINNLHLLK